MSMQGIEVCAVADINLDYVKQAYITNRIPPESIQVAYTIQGMNQIIQNGKLAITEEGLLVARTDLLDVVVEATGIPEVGARLAYETITHHKHLIMVNVETDVTVGPFLRRLADNAGVVYSLVDGDQPGVTMNIVEWARTLGLEIIAAGRGTVFYDGDRAGTPDTVPERFGFDEEMLKRRTINLKMFNSFRDGSKAQIEMCALANMTGLLPDVRSMHEPSVDIADIPQVFSLAEEGGILQQHGVVELANSIGPDGRTMLEDPLRMGVFVVIRTDHPFIQEDLHSYHLHSSDNGQNYLL
ncbi:TPA: NAD(P)-dependent oxidoreductase, partial [Candidatus Poribacteria bacterium]|nr:NAD(P)-dependent oxidoreductase [Candidatus Poribacteria bacterium]